MAIVAMANITSSDGLVPQAGLGDTFETGGATYRYFKSSAAIAQYALCSVSNAFVAIGGTTGTVSAKPTLFCIPQFAIDAADEYFWAPVGPFQLREDGVTTFKVLGAALCAGSVRLYTTGTTGVVDDSVTTLVAGLCLTETLVGAEAADCIAVQTLTARCQD